MARTLTAGGILTGGGRGRVRTGGFTYIALLIVIAVMGAALAEAGQVWYAEVQREREQELLFIGHQMRAALVSYYNTGAGYPMSLEDLVKDPRIPATKRHLRKIYPDPITGSTKWGMVKGPNGGILGVYSLSDDEPVKKSNFDFADRMFEGKTKYSEWIFMIPPRNIQVPANAANAFGAQPRGPLPQRMIP